MVGNGAFIKCQGICPLVDISLQNSTFTIPFYLLPIEGADVVLGVEWLSTLGSIQADFSIPSIQFTHNNQHITLQAPHSPNPSATTYHQFCHYLSNNSIASLHLLSVDTQHCPHTTLATTINNPTSPLSHLPSPIQSLLQEYQGIFQKPRGYLHRDHMTTIFLFYLIPHQSKWNHTDTHITTRKLLQHWYQKCCKRALFNLVQAHSLHRCS